jgi:hypothetical protein
MSFVRRKRPFFLLEIVISIFLVGLFSVYFLRSSIHCLYQERKALLDLEFEREFDLRRMNLIRSNWNKIEQLPLRGDAKEEIESIPVTLGGKKYIRKKSFKVYRRQKQHDGNFNLILEEKEDKKIKKYHFFVKKSEAKA